MRHNNKLLLILIILSIALIACGGGDNEDTATSVAEPTVAPVEDTSAAIDEIKVEGDFKILLEALKAADMLGMLNEIGPYTIFAPGDPIFEAYFEEQGITKEEFLADIDSLKKILSYHIAEDVFGAARLSLMDGETVITLVADAGIVIAVDEEGKITLNDTVSIIQPDFVASNGVIHAIDAVLAVP